MKSFGLIDFEIWGLEASNCVKKRDFRRNVFLGQNSFPQSQKWSKNKIFSKIIKITIKVLLDVLYRFPVLF